MRCVLQRRRITMGTAKKKRLRRSAGMTERSARRYATLWFVGADGAVLEEENFAFKELEKLGSAFVLYRGYEVSGVSDMLFGVQEQGAVRLLKQMGHFELDDDGDLMAWTAGTEAAPGYYDISLRTLTEYRLEEIREKELLQYKNGKAVLKSILRQVGSDSGKIQILSGENDRIHVSFSDAEGSWIRDMESGKRQTCTDRQRRRQCKRGS